MTEPRGLRSDAERNRAKILTAACEAFTEGGLDAVAYGRPVVAPF